LITKNNEKQRNKKEEIKWVEKNWNELE